MTDEDKIEKVIQDLNQWGKEELNRPNFGDECLWANALQGVAYRIGIGYQESLTSDINGRTNTNYTRFFDKHSAMDTPYLYVWMDYNVVGSVWTIDQVKEIAKKQQQKQAKYLTNLANKASRINDLDQLNEFLHTLDKYNMPDVFPASNFIIYDETWEKFLTYILNQHKNLLVIVNAAIEKNKLLKSDPYPYTKFFNQD